MWPGGCPHPAGVSRSGLQKMSSACSWAGESWARWIHEICQRHTDLQLWETQQGGKPCQNEEAGWNGERASRKVFSGQQKTSATAKASPPSLIKAHIKLNMCLADGILQIPARIPVNPDHALGRRVLPLLQVGSRRTLCQAVDQILPRFSRQYLGKCNHCSNNYGTVAMKEAWHAGSGPWLTAPALSSSRKLIPAHKGFL